MHRAGVLNTRVDLRLFSLTMCLSGTLLLAVNGILLAPDLRAGFVENGAMVAMGMMATSMIWRSKPKASEPNATS